MVSKELTIINPQGFHLRPAQMFAAAMAKYACSVTIKFNGKDVNGKSPLFIVPACIKCGSVIDIVCDGPDEEAALAEAVQMVENGFGEI